MGTLLGMVMIFMAGIAGIIFSILAQRLKQEIFFILGCVTSAIVLIYIIWNFQWWWAMINSADGAFMALIILSFLVIPIIFLVQSKQAVGSNDGDSDVTVDFLEEVINSEDEEIDFEDDLDNIDESDFHNL